MDTVWGSWLHNSYLSCYFFFFPSQKKIVGIFSIGNQFSPFHALKRNLAENAPHSESSLVSYVKQ